MRPADAGRQDERLRGMSGCRGGAGRAGGCRAGLTAADLLYDAILIHAFIVTGVQLGRYGTVPVVITSRQFTSLLVAIP